MKLKKLEDPVSFLKTLLTQLTIYADIIFKSEIN